MAEASRVCQRTAQAAAEGAEGINGGPIGRLSNRELQVLSLIGRGLSSREAADGLSLSVKTVETHRQSLKRKLKLATNAAAVRDHRLRQSSRIKTIRP